MFGDLFDNKNLMLKFANNLRQLRLVRIPQLRPIYFFGGGHHEPVEREKIVLRDDKHGMKKLMYRLLS